jgi:hypothetical protein
MRSADAAKAAEHPVEQPYTIILGALARSRLELEQGFHQWHDAGNLIRARAEFHAQGVRVARTSKTLERLHKWLIGQAGGTLRIAVADECKSAPLLDEGEKLLAEGGFADAGLTHQHHHRTPATAGGGLERGPKLLQLIVTADERQPSFGCPLLSQPPVNKLIGSL